MAVCIASIAVMTLENRSVISSHNQLKGSVTNKNQYHIHLSPTPFILKEFQLGARKELTLIARELRKSKEWPIMQKIAKQNEMR
jgi:hypothetical protein